MSSNFVYDNTALPSAKADVKSVTNATRQWSASDANAVLTALADIQSVLRDDAFSAKNFGAKGDGVTHDHVAINAALTAAGSVSTGAAFGGAVLLPSGTYMIGAPLVIPNGVELRGSGPGTVIKLANTFSAVAAIKNTLQDGTQEFANLSGFLLDCNQAGGAVCSEAGISWGSLFINSFIRDVTIINSSSVGLHVFASNGMGPILIANVWVANCLGHNIFVEEKAGNTNACAGVYLDHVTSENWGASSSSIYLKGIGSSGNYTLANIHFEHGNTETGLTGLTLDGVSHVRVRNLQIQRGGSASYTQAILITNVGQNVDIEIDDATNINSVNPVLVNNIDGTTLGAINIHRYCTSDYTIMGGPRFAPATNNTTVGQHNVALAFQAFSGGNVFGASYPGGGGGVLRWRYTTGGIDIMQWDTDGSVFVYQGMTLQSLLTLQASLKGPGTRAAAPSTGTHVAGEIVFNADPTAGGKVGWVCTAGGTPGTWKAFGAIDP